MAEAGRDDFARSLVGAVQRRALLRRLSALIGVASAGAARSSDEVGAGSKRRKRRRRCLTKPNRTWCANSCVLGTCCAGKPCGENCTCARAIEGDTYCAANGIVECSAGLCANSGACDPGSRDPQSRCVALSSDPSLTCCRPKC